jgi:hypothetical protein
MYTILHSTASIRVEVNLDRVRRMLAPRHLDTRLDRYSINLSLEISRIQIPQYHRTSALRFRALLTEAASKVELTLV